MILDVAHNPHASSYLAKYIKNINKNNKIITIVGMLSDKNIPKTLKPLHKITKKWYCVSLKHEKQGRNANQIAKHIKNKKTEKCENVLYALKKAIKTSSKNDCILIFGSFHTISPIMKSLKINTNPIIR